MFGFNKNDKKGNNNQKGKERTSKRRDNFESLNEPDLDNFEEETDNITEEHHYSNDAENYDGLYETDSDDETTTLFGSEDNLDQVPQTIENYLYNLDNIEDFYNLAIRGETRSESFVELCSDINSLIKSGVIVDKVSKISVHTLEGLVYKVYAQLLEYTLDSKAPHLQESNDEEIEAVRVEYEEQIESLENDRKEMALSIKQLETSKQEALEQLEALTSEHNELVDKYNEAVANDSNNIEMENKLSNLSEQFSMIQKQYNILEDELNSKSQELADSDRELKLVSAKLKAKETELDDSRAELSRMLQETPVPAVDEDLENRLREQAKVISARDEAIANLNENCLKMQTELIKAKREIASRVPTDNIIPRFEKTIAMINQELLDVNDENIELLTQNRNLEDKLNGCKRELDTLRSLSDGYKARLAAKDNTSKLDANEVVETIQKRAGAVDLETEHVLVYAGVKLVSITSKIKPEYRGNISLIVNKIVEDKDNLTTSNILERFNVILKDMLTESIITK